MKLNKKDIPKVILLIGIFVIALGIFLNFMKKDVKEGKQEKIEWNNEESEQQETPPTEEEQTEIPIDGAGEGGE